jgi:hypothetical protein
VNLIQIKLMKGKDNLKTTSIQETILKNQHWFK